MNLKSKLKKYTKVTTLILALGVGSVLFSADASAAYTQGDNDNGSNWSTGTWQKVSNSQSISGNHRYMAAQSNYEYGWKVGIPVTSLTTGMHVHLMTTQAGNPTARYYRSGVYAGTLDQSAYATAGMVRVGSWKSSEINSSKATTSHTMSVDANGRGKTVADLARLYND